MSDTFWLCQEYIADLFTCYITTKLSMSVINGDHLCIHFICLSHLNKTNKANDDNDDDCRFVKRITQDASTALRVPVRCEEVSFQR